jgi:hypothetical protein
MLMDTQRDSSDSKADQNFAFTNDVTDEHIFAHHEDLLEVKDNIARVLSRQGYKGQPFDENQENVKECVRKIRSYLNMRERYSVEFEICEVKMVPCGTFAINLRSDMV